MMLNPIPVEPETARVGIVLREGIPCGAATLLNRTTLLTCRHVVAAATMKEAPSLGDTINVDLIGFVRPLQVTTSVVRLAEGADPYADDLALLQIADGQPQLAIGELEFAAPMVHSGKDFAVMGFPDGFDHGLHATGILRAADRSGLVQMDGSRVIAVTPGFSGAPVWSTALRAFVGIVVAAEQSGGLAWLIPARRLARFYPDLRAKFRVVPADRPVIHDYEIDDPNRQLFGEASASAGRRLTAWRKRKRVYVRYECLKGGPEPRGTYVTFITYPDFTQEHEDAYELFAPLEQEDANDVTHAATTYLYPAEPFTIAAIGDAGETALTLDLTKAISQ